jgi:hypothetical protein
MIFQAQEDATEPKDDDSLVGLPAELVQAGQRPVGRSVSIA